MKVGENIRKIRIERGLTQKELGEKCGIADSAIRRYELGRANPKLETLEKLANALNCDITDLADSESRLSNYIDLSILSEKQITSLLTFETNTQKKQADTFKRIKKYNEEIENIFFYKQKLLSYFDELNQNGKQKAIEQLEMLTKIPEYTIEHTIEYTHDDEYER